MEEVKIERGKVYALRLLRIRPRSERELRRRLAIRRIPSREIDRIIEDLKQLDLINDREFARSFIEAKLNALHSKKFVRRQLSLFGINEEIIDDMLREVYQEEKLKVLLEDKIRRLSAKYAALPLFKRKAKIYEYFIRRGFAGDFILQCIEQIQNS